jgi:hypothetical protein
MKIVISLLLLLFFGCHESSLNEHPSLINLSHLDHLSEDIVIDGEEMRIVHIYSENPDYQLVKAPNEGIACVDDIARATVLLLRLYKATQEDTVLKNVKKMINFLIYMQADNGCFYNFILSDLSINRVHKNSVPRTDWWTWRAIWALAEAYEIFLKTNPDFAKEIYQRIKRTYPSIDSLLQSYPQIKKIEGLQLPTYLPYGTASDQAAVLLQALIPIYLLTEDDRLKDFVNKLSQGIIQMQAGDSLNFPFHSFLSWKNIWHAYGNSQAYALLRVADKFDNPIYLNKALKEIKYFYPFLIKKKYLNQFIIKQKEQLFVKVSEQQFPQIAYDIRPMVWASLAAYRLTHQERFARQAGEIACWLLGKNISNLALYDPKTGRCYDGINARNVVNLNSGAESTIEALLTILEIEKHSISKEIFHDFYF